VLIPLPFPCSETIDLTQDDERGRKKKVVKEATRQKWVEQYPWIVWTNKMADSGNHRAKCRVCLEQNPDTNDFGNTMGDGAAVQDANDLKRHANGAHHKLACERSLKQSGGKGSIQSGMAGLMKRATAETLEVVPIMLYCALWLMIEGMPGSKFPSLLVLARILGAKGLVNKYNNHKYFWSCMYAISELTMCSVLDAATKSPYYALLCDGSTDIACQNNVMVYVRYLDMLSFKYVTDFLCCVRVSADTSDHHTAIMSGIIEACRLDPDKFVSMCTDGAPTYTGVHNGTVKQLREKYNPFLVGVHCSAHKTALSINDVALQKGVLQDCLDHADSLLKGAHALFAKSYKRNEEWIAFSKARGVTEFKFPLFARTRWLSRYNCLRVLTRNMHVLMAFLERYNAVKHDPMCWAEAVNYRKRLNSLKSVSLLFLMLDLVTPMHELSLKFQLDSILPHQVHVFVELCKGQLTSMFISPVSFKQTNLPNFKGKFLPKVTAKGVWSPAEGYCFQLRTCKLSVLHALLKKIAVFLVEKLDERFESSALLKNFLIFVPDTYLGMPAEDLQKFGSEMLRALLVHFCASHLGEKRLFIVTGRESIIAAEFLALKKALFQVVNELNQTNATFIWRKLFVEQAHLYFPNLFLLVQIMFLIPVQTAVVERGFSLHKIIKSKLRNRLQIMTIDSLLRVKLLCTDLEGFDVDAAAKKYVVSPDGSSMVLNRLHKKVSDIEVGRLEDGIDEGEPNFDFDFNENDDISDGGDGDHVEDDALWLDDDGEGSEGMEEASIFASMLGSEAVAHMEGEASFLADI